MWTSREILPCPLPGPPVLIRPAYDGFHTTVKFGLLADDNFLQTGHSGHVGPARIYLGREGHIGPPATQVMVSDDTAPGGRREQFRAALTDEVRATARYWATVSAEAPE